MPTYQEAEALPLFVERFAATGLELLIVDDASPDGTGAIADALAAQRPWMHVLHRAGKEGLGVAYRAGFAWCLARGYRAIGQMDCDLSHPPEKLAEMLAVLDGREADLVIANRYLPGGGTANWSRTRRALSRVGCTMSRLVLGLPYDDLSGGFKLWRAIVPGRPRPRRPARRRLRVPDRDDPARAPARQAHRGGALRVQRARGGRLEDVAGDLAGGHRRLPAPAPPRPRALRRCWRRASRIHAHDRRTGDRQRARRDSNPRLPPPEGGALSTELLARVEHRSAGHRTAASC